MVRVIVGLLALWCLTSVAEAQDYAAIDRMFADYVLDEHIPGLVYGVVSNGQLVHVQSYGEQDIVNHRPVTADTLFRIASMTKAFTALTILKLRDDGRLRLDDLAENYVPELRGWRYPTKDSPRITIRDLLNHVAGFATDNPLGDRQTPMAESDFTALLKQGVMFNQPPQMGYEYSNLGFAILGRIITAVSGAPFADTISRTLLQPLAMTATGFDAAAAPAERRALGYRWQDHRWLEEPYLAPGAFGAMGGVQTSARDYGKWLAFLLSAWPPRDDDDLGPVKRSSVRELADGSNFPRLRSRFGDKGANPCRQAANYAMGLNVALDCDLGLTLSHGGGYPGYGSHMLLLPERGVAIFAFANRTYAGPAAPIWQAALELQRSGTLPPVRTLAAGADLVSAYDKVAKVYQSGRLDAVRSLLAVNFLLDRDETAWNSELAALKAELGDCPDRPAIAASGALNGNFIWRCAHGRLQGRIELTSTLPVQMQTLELSVLRP